MAVAVVVVPLALALSSDHLAGEPLSLVVSTGAGALAVSALALQPLLVARYGTTTTARRSRVRVHRTLGAVTLALVLVHLGGLYLLEQDDTLFALSPDGPTRARMAVLGTVALVAIVALGVLRGRIRAADSSWRLVHAFLAILVIALGVGHAVLTDGALDGAGTVVLVGLGAWGLAATALAHGQSVRTLRRATSVQTAAAADRRLRTASDGRPAEPAR